MLLPGKKIGFALTVKQLSNTMLLREIEKIMLSGAELFIILLELPEKTERVKYKLQSIFRFLDPVDTLANPPENLSRPFLDLLVLIPNSVRFLNLLEHITAEEYTGMPLVLVPILKNEPAFSLGYISSLMKKNNIYFVPFGPVEQKNTSKTENVFLCSRLDLLLETCIAAFAGEQLKPSTWENHFFPH